MKLEVNLTHNPYDIIIEKGALKTVGQWVKSLWEPQKIALITDNHVGALYAEKVKLSLEHEGFEVVVFDFLEGEASKNLKTVNKAYEFLIKNGMTRSDLSLQLICVASTSFRFQPVSLPKWIHLLVVRRV